MDLWGISGCPALGNRMLDWVGLTQQSSYYISMCLKVSSSGSAALWELGNHIKPIAELQQKGSKCGLRSRSGEPCYAQLFFNNKNKSHLNGTLNLAIVLCLDSQIPLSTCWCRWYWIRDWKKTTYSVFPNALQPCDTQHRDLAFCLTGLCHHTKSPWTAAARQISPTAYCHRWLTRSTVVSYYWSNFPFLASFKVT